MNTSTAVAEKPEFTRASRRQQRERAQRVDRAINLAPVGQFVPGLTQYLTGRRLIGLIGVISSALGLIGLIALTLAFVIDRRIGLGWATQERPLAIITIVALALALIWFTLGIHLAVLLWRNRTPHSGRGWRAALVILVALAQLLTAGTIAYYANVQREFIGDLFPTVPTPASPPVVDDSLQVPVALLPQPVTAGRVNILILGGDAGPGRWGLRPDSISVVSINLDTADTTIIGVPRNLQQAPFSDDSPLWGPYPDGYNCGNSCLISYLYTYATLRPELYPGATNPGVEATRDAVEGVLGIELHYAVLMDMGGFKDLIDAIGGVDVCVPVAVPHVEAGCQLMDGAKALIYARARSESDDFNRMAKQRLIQQSLLTQADPLTVLQNFQELTAAGAKYIYTDIPQDGLGILLDAALRAQGTPAETIELVPPLISTANPDFAAIRATVAEALSDD